MKFEISFKGINHKNNIPPCSEAFKGSYIYTDIRSVSSPSALPDSQTWYEAGSNHRSGDGCIMRDFIKIGWLVEFETIEELLSFCAKYGAITIEEFGQVAAPTIKINPFHINNEVTKNEY